MYIVKARNQHFVLRLEATEGHEEESSCLRHYYATLIRACEQQKSGNMLTRNLRRKWRMDEKEMEERYHSIAIWHASVGGQTSIVAGISTTHIQALIISEDMLTK